MDRLKRLLSKTLNVDQPDACWVWTGTKDDKGYGILNVNYKRKKAHRLSWELHKGPIPDGLFVLHTCDNRPCINPSHLLLGTLIDNNADMVVKSRQAVGEKINTAKLTEEQVLYARAVWVPCSKGPFGLGTLSRQYGVTRETLYGAVTGESWKHLPGARCR